MTVIDFNGVQPITENFMGCNAVYHGYAGMPDDKGRVYSDELCEIEADRAATLGVRVARTFYKWYAYDEKTNTWNWDSEKMTVFYNWLSRMQKRNIQVAINIGWCFPGDINSSSWNGKSPFTVEGDWEQSVKNYAHWVSETLHQIIEVRGFTNVKYVHLFTEPQYYLGRVLPNGEKNTTKIYAETIMVVHKTLVRDGRRNLVKIIGPNEGSTTTSLLNKYVAKHADEAVDIYSSHNYWDYLPPEANEVKKTIPGVCLTVAGARVFQYLRLEPNTDYVVKLSVSAYIKDMLTVSGSFSFGAWSVDSALNFGVESGGSATNRLSLESVKMVDPVALNNGGETLLEHTFNSGDLKECFIAAFSDIKNKDSRVFVNSFNVFKKGADIGLLKNTDLTKLTDGDLRVFSRDPYELSEQDWVTVGGRVDCPAPYFFTQNCVNTSLRYVPKNEPFWFDEYNVRCEINSFDTPLHGTHRAAIMMSLINSGAESSLMWTLFDQQWPSNHSNNADGFVDGDHRYGVMPVLTRSLVPYPSYYAVGIIMKYMGGSEGTKILPFNGDGLLSASASLMPEGNVTIAIVNNKALEDEAEISLSHLMGKTLYKRVYNPETVAPDEKAEMLPVLETFESDGKLSVKLPPNSVVVYTTVKE